jgi:hypothetical protein
VQQYDSDVSESELGPVLEESSEAWEDASDQTEAEEEDAEEARELLYGPFRYEVMKGGESSSPQFIFEEFEGYEAEKTPVAVCTKPNR